MQCDEANEFLLGASLEFKGKTALMESLSRNVVSSTSSVKASADFGLVENILKTAFFRELVDAGVLDRSVMELLRMEQDQIADPNRWRVEDEDDWGDRTMDEEGSDGRWSPERKGLAGAAPRVRSPSGSPRAAGNNNRTGRPMPSFAGGATSAKGIADERDALSRASRAASVAKSRTQEAERELQSMARELSVRRSQLQQAEQEADRLVQQLIRG